MEGPESMKQNLGRLIRPVLVLAAAVALATLLPAMRFGHGPRARVFPSGKWAQSALDSMSLDEKIGQLFMVAAYSNKDEAHCEQIEKLVREEHIGGLIFMQGGPARQIALVNRYQRAARFPLLISQDSEWGLTMRLDSTQRYPKNMTLGAIRDSLLVFELGMQMGKECRRVGVQVNFAPVVDVNNNRLNPVIHDRSFGEDRENVTTKAYHLYKGLEYSGTIGCIKHFPGHGDTDTDSHHDLPVIPFSRKRLDSLELYPFKQLINRGIASVMVAHLYIPALDATPNLASTLSPKIVNGLLRQELGFQGLAFTDALNMKGVAKFWTEGEADLRALLAGNDVLLFSGDVPKAKTMIKRALSEGKLTEKEIDARVLKILLAKEWAGLHQQRLTPGLTPGTLVNSETKSLSKRLYQKAMTVVKNENGLLPFGGLESRSFAAVEIGSSAPTDFYQTLRTYAPVQHALLASDADKAKRDQVLASISAANTVVVALGGMNKSAAKQYGISEGSRQFIKDLKARGKSVVVVVFGSPYALQLLGTDEHAILVAYEDCQDARVAAAEALFGAIPVDGRLPVTGSNQFQVGTGITLVAANRLKFGLPQDAGMDGSVLEGIDGIAAEAIRNGATPGLAVMVLRGNTIVFDRAYGKTEYGSAGCRVDPFATVYDLASVTKVLSTTACAMRLFQEGKLELDKPVNTYLEDWEGNEMTVTVRDLLMHTAGFKAWLPFHHMTMDETGNGPNPAALSTTRNDTFCIPIIDGLYMCTNMQDSMWVKIQSEGFKKNKDVLYSDLSMIVLRRVLESVSGVPIERFVDSVYYRPMGMGSTCFNPALNHPEWACAPTEMDTVWRKGKVQGYVHDQAAAMLGGVSGHAGLFSNLYDVGKMLFMMKNGGNYGGTQYLRPEVVALFTSKQVSGNRKALGWDRPGDGGTLASKSCSDRTFGHTGFTGIAVWVDPAYDVAYVFLSNRTFPDAGNKKLINDLIRPRMQDLIYQSIASYRTKAGA